MHEKFETRGDFGCPKGAEKVNFSPKSLNTLKISDIKP